MADITLSFDTSTRSSTEPQCSGCILSPSSREGHAAALVGDINLCMFWCSVDGRTRETAGVGKLSHLRFSLTYDIQLGNGSHFKTWDQDQSGRMVSYAIGSNVIWVCDRELSTGTQRTRTKLCSFTSLRLSQDHSAVKPTT